MRDAAALWDVEVDDLIGITKVRELVLPRAAVVMVLRDEPPMSYSQIGRLLCRDHSTIINLERIAHRQFCDDVAFRAKVAVLRSQIVPKTECV
nr:helix-turn-helix domain-containing protein [Sphingopyxis alaskensis]